MSTNSHSQSIPNVLDQEVAQPTPRVPHSSEEEPTEDQSAEAESNNSGSNQEAQSRNAESRSWNLLRHERQPSSVGPLPPTRAEEAGVPLTDPYLQGIPNHHITARFLSTNPHGEGTSRANAGPSNVHDYFSWESFMRREFGIEDPNVVAGVPVERTSGMSMDEFRQMQAITESLIHTRERVTQQAEALEGAYFHAEVAKVMAMEGRDKMESVVRILGGLIVLVVALLITVLFKM